MFCVFKTKYFRHYAIFLRGEGFIEILAPIIGPATDPGMRGENISEYRWYLDMLRDGIRPSAGFGIGVERLTRWICGLKNIWDAVPFPKVPGVMSP